MSHDIQTTRKKKLFIYNSLNQQRRGERSHVLKQEISDQCRWISLISISLDYHADQIFPQLPTLP